MQNQHNLQKTELLFRSEDKSAILKYHQQFGYLEHILVGKISHQNYQQINNHCFESIDKYNCRNILFNFKDLEGTDIFSRGWYTTVYLPKVFKRYGSNFNCSIIKSKNLFENTAHKFAVKAAVRLGMQGEIKYFETVDEATNWLKIKTVFT